MYLQHTNFEKYKQHFENVLVVKILNNNLISVNKTDTEKKIHILILRLEEHEGKLTKVYIEHCSVGSFDNDGFSIMAGENLVQIRHGISHQWTYAFTESLTIKLNMHN